MQPSSPVLVSIDLPRLGDELGSYRIERQLGQGGMAVVYEARHVVLGKRVAIKMLLPHHAACPELAQRFQREGEAAAMLDHANAVAVLDGGSDARGTPYLVLEYLEGEDLGTVLARDGQLSVEQAVDLLVPMIAAISEAHDLGIVHRDLKPENLFLARRRGQLVPKVLDFGISKTNDAESLKLTRSESLLGTPHYMSPEQAQGASQADARTDQFAIGVMLYECVTGRCPFEGSSLFAVLAAIVGGTMTPLNELVPGIDPLFEAAVTRALNKDPDARFPHLRALGNALLPLASTRVRLNYASELGTEADAYEQRPDVVTSERGRRSTVHDILPRVTVPMPVEPTGAAPSLPPGASSARTPLLVGSAFVLATVAGLGANSLRDNAEPQRFAPRVAGRTRRATPVEAPQAQAPRTQVAPAADKIEERRKPSGLRFEPIEAPSLCASEEPLSE